MFIKKMLCGGILLLILPTLLSHAEVGRKEPSLDGLMTAGPYYNPASKSYFEMIKSTDGGTWHKINIYAQERVFKNAQGHLAIIKNLETHQFILRNFKSPTEFWIGLQYLCPSKSLRWVDGTIISNADFTAWGHKWARTHIRCSGKGYMPVTYTRRTQTTPPRWQATGPSKGFVYYLVEYPTGKE